MTNIAHSEKPWSWYDYECIRSRADTPISEGEAGKAAKVGGSMITKAAAVALIVSALGSGSAHAQFRGGQMMRPAPMMQAPLFRGPLPMPMQPIYRNHAQSTPMFAPSYRMPFNPVQTGARFATGHELIQRGYPVAGRLIRGSPWGMLLWPEVAR